MEDGITSAYASATSAEVKADSLADTIIDFNSLETVEELGENDKVLVSSGGDIKQIGCDDLVDKIADQMEAGGSSSGGSDVFDVVYVVSTQNYSVTCNKSIEEIVTASQSGKSFRVTVQFDGLDGKVSYNCLYTVQSAITNNAWVRGLLNIYDNGTKINVYMFSIRHNSNDTCEYFEL